MSCVTIERCDSASFSSVISTSLANAKSWSEEKEIVSQSSSTESEPKQVLEHVREDEVEVYWVSYMNGEQRVLLFTQHESIYLKAKSVIDPEISKREIFLSIAAIGVSVVRQLLKVYVLYKLDSIRIDFFLLLDRTRIESLSGQTGIVVRQRYRFRCSLGTLLQQTMEKFVIGIEYLARK